MLAEEYVIGHHRSRTIARDCVESETEFWANKVAEVLVLKCKTLLL